MAATPARSSRPACVAPRAGSRWRSSNDRTWPEASPSCPSDGLSSGPSHGSTAAVVWPRIGNASTATRSRFCAGPRFASWSEGFVKPQHDPGQTLRESVGQAREPAHAHPYSQVLALDVAGRDMVLIRSTLNDFLLSLHDLRRAVAARPDRSRLIYLDCPIPGAQTLAFGRRER